MWVQGSRAMAYGPHCLDAGFRVSGLGFRVSAWIARLCCSQRYSSLTVA